MFLYFPKKFQSSEKIGFRLFGVIPIWSSNALNYLNQKNFEIVHSMHEKQLNWENLKF